MMWRADIARHAINTHFKHSLLGYDNRWKQDDSVQGGYIVDSTSVETLF